MMPVQKEISSNQQGSIGTRAFWIFFAPLIVLLFNLAFFNKYFPLTEGWWETYGYLLNSGLVPYKDFNIEFPLLFVFINKLLLKYLPDSFFLYRLIGVLAQVALAFILQFSLEKIFSRKTAAVSTLFAMLLTISNPIFIAKDYHTFVDLVLGLTFLLVSFIYLDVRRLGTNKIGLMKVFVLGLLIAFLVLVKQNIGVLVFAAYVIVFISLPRQSISSKIAAETGLLAGFAFGVAVYVAFMMSQSVDVKSILEVLSKNDSKGSISVVLFRFLIDKSISRIIGAAFFLGALFVAVTYSSEWFKSKWMEFWSDSGKANAAALVSLFFLFSAAIFTKGLALTVVIIPLAIAVLILVILRFYIFRDISQELGVSLLLPPLVALVYCNTHTAGLNFPGMLFVIAFTSALAFEYIVEHTAVKPVLLSSLLLLPAPFLIFKKLEVPYDWWGFKQSSVLHSEYSLPYPQTRGIYVDSITRDAFGEISAAIDKFSRTDSDVYLFPDIPIFYYLHKKKPPYKSVVQWFDVIGSVKIEKELSDFESNPPNLVVFLDPPDFVYAGHANLLRRELPHARFKESFEKLVDDDKYVAYRYRVYDRADSAPYRTSPLLKLKIKVRNSKYFGKEISYLYQDLGKPSGFEIKNIVRNGADIAISSHEIIHKNDLFVVEIDKRLVKTIADSVGYLVGADLYTLKIYVRKSLAK